MWIPLQSDGALAGAVSASTVNAVVPVAGLGALPGAGSTAAPYELPVSPIGFLLAAGRATAAVGTTSMARFNTVGWWSVLRWFWTVDVVAAGHVELTPDSDNIKSHHRAAFSEAFGLGVCLLLAEYLLASGVPGVPVSASAAGAAPVIVDIDSVLPGNVRRPDLWILDGLPQPGAAPASVLAEAKGRTPSGTIASELANGTDQVLAVSGDARRLVAGVEVPRTALNAFAIEVPPAASAWQSGPGGSDPVDGEPAQEPPHAGFGAGGDLSDVSAEVIAGADAARLRTFAALDDLAEVQRRSRAIAPGVSVDIEGATFRVQGPDRRVEATVGLLALVADELRMGGRDPTRLQRTRAASREVRNALPSEEPEVSSRVAIADDGCIVSARLL